MDVKTQYYKERNRIKRFIAKKTKEGYHFDYNIPDEPQRITEASVRVLKKITPKKLYETATYTSPDTGETVSARRHINKTRIEAAKRGAHTRRVNRLTDLYFNDHELYEELREEASDRAAKLNHELVNYAKRSWEEIRHDTTYRRLQKEFQKAYAIDNAFIDSERNAKLVHDREYEEQYRDYDYDEYYDNDFSQTRDKALEEWKEREREKIREEERIKARREAQEELQREREKNLPPSDWKPDLTLLPDIENSPDECFNTLEAMREALDAWSPVANWTESLEAAKERDKNRLQRMLEGQIELYGEAIVAQRLIGKADLINELVQSVLYASGSHEGNFRDGRTEVNQHLNQLAEILKGSPLTVEESKALTEDQESLDVYN